MIEKISLVIYRFVDKYISIEKEMAEVYKYGIEITVSSVLNICLIMILALFLGEPLCGVMFLICLILIRSYCGGFHANSYFRCNCCMLISFGLVYFISKVLLVHDWTDIRILSILLLLFFVPVYFFSPVKNPYKELDESKVKRCRKISIALYFLISIIGLIFTFCGSIYGLIAIITLIEVSVMIIVEILTKRRDKDESSDNSGQGYC